MLITLFVVILTALSSVLFLFMLLTSKKYDAFIEPLDKKEFAVKEIYGVGFKLTEIMKIDFRSKQAKKMRQEAVILYGEKYAEFYLRVIYARMFSLAFLTFVGACVFSSFAQGTDKIMLFGIGVVISGAVYLNYSSASSKKIKKRSEQFLMEFPNAVSTIALLVNAGLMLREAWSQVSESNDAELYVQMRKVSEDINNGISEIDALYAFAGRCATNEIKKFTALIVQGLEKGSKDLAISLKNQSEELWESKKQHVLKQGELASSKLLIPIMIMFVGVLIMVMGPIMYNLGAGI